MKWKNSNKDGLPKHEEKVLISLDGVNYIGTFDVFQNGFYINDHTSFLPIDVVANTIYWQPIEKPNEGTDKQQQG